MQTAGDNTTVCPTTSATPSRRAVLGAAAVLPLAALPAVADAAPAGDDADLIRLCHEFAERQLWGFYQFALASDDTPDDLVSRPGDWTAYRQIVATPARTPAGWQAKALAYSAWHQEAYHDDSMQRDSHTTFLASLLQDMVRPARNAIMARLAAKYGPLPASYTPEGAFLGQPAALASALCQQSGPCPCSHPCEWGQAAVRDIARDGWPFGGAA